MYTGTLTQARLCLSLIKEVSKVDEEETPLLQNCQGAISPAQTQCQIPQLRTFAEGTAKQRYQPH